LAKVCRDASYDPLIKGGLLDKTRLQDSL
jgi:hypothetical protein